MSNERDKFLTEAIGECWRTDCKDCDLMCDGITCSAHPNFSTWEGFGELWEWAQGQEWWQTEFKHTYWRMLDTHLEFVPDLIVHPDRFADALYGFLKEKP